MLTDPARENPPDLRLVGPALAVDTGSPVISVAVGIDGRVIEQQAMELERSSGRLLALVDRVLEEAGLRPAGLQALVGLRGPGSFTGLRVGLATLLGMRQALALPVATLPTLQVLASLAPTEPGVETVACVDALRGQWLAQRFRAGSPPSAIDAPHHVSGLELVQTRSGPVVGFGVSRLRGEIAASDDRILVEPGPLAGRSLELLASGAADWDPHGLTAPLYLQPPIKAPRSNRRA